MRLYRLILIIILIVLPVQMVTHAQACNAQTPEDWNAQADNDYELGNYEEAIAGYTCVIQLGGELASEGYEWRGNAYGQLGNLEQALQDHNLAVTDATNDSAYYSRANTFLNRGEYELAIADYNESIATGYSWSFVYNNRGVAYDRLGDKENALADFRLAASLDSENGLAWSNYSELLFYFGDMESARENIEYGISESTGIEQSYAYENRGLFAFLDGDTMSAINDYTTAIERNPDNLSAYINRAQVYQVTDSPNQYADYLRYIQAMPPDIIDLPENNGVFVDEPLDMSEHVVYRASFMLSSGQYFTATASADEDSEIDPLIVLLGPSGSAVMGDDDSGSNLDAVINRFPIAQDGIYTLLITHSIDGSDGTVLLSTRVRNDTYQDIITTQLRVNERAEIFSISNEGIGIVNLREYPTTEYEVLTQLESGTRVTLINGPYKGVDFVWWQVQTDDDTIGWMVEYLGGVQILSPAIEVGDTVIIDTAELNFRAEPTVNAELVRSLFREADVMFTVIDGPVEADNLTWWQLRLDGENGFDAWAVERVGVNPTLAVVLDR